MLDEREAIGRVRAVDHEADADAAEEALGAVARGDDSRGGGCRGHVFLSLDSSVA
jgi:hypothetical protein